MVSVTALPAAPPALDLRPTPDAHAHLPHHMIISGNAPRVHQSSVQGYEVAAQFVNRKGLQAGVRIRLAAPDGRVLNIVGPRHEHAKDASEAVARVLSPRVRQILRTQRRTDDLRERMADAVERGIAEGLRCLSEGVQGTSALIRVGAAVEQVDPAQVLSFDPFAPLGVSLLAAGGLSVSQVVILMRHGFTRDTAIAWFGNSLRVPDESTVKAMAAFRDAGWTLSQVQVAEGFERGFALEAAKRDGVPYRNPKPSAVWGLAALSWEEASLAMWAGLPAKTAVRVKQSGEWNEEALATLRALRSGALVG